MRTTVVLNDDVFREAKIRAAQRKISLSEFINDAVREALVQPRRQAGPFALITYGDRATRSRHEPSDFTVAAEREDQERLR